MCWFLFFVIHYFKALPPLRELPPKENVLSLRQPVPKGKCHQYFSARSFFPPGCPRGVRTQDFWATYRLWEPHIAWRKEVGTKLWLRGNADVIIQCNFLYERPHSRDWVYSLCSKFKLAHPYQIGKEVLQRKGKIVERTKFSSLAHCQYCYYFIFQSQSSWLEH